MDRLLHKFSQAVKQEMAELAEANCLQPRSEPFEHGVQVGRYQGLKAALELLDAQIREEHNQE